MDRLPIDLLQDILRPLALTQCLGSLACFLRCNRFTYALALPILYCHVELDLPSRYDAFVRGLVLPVSSPREPSRPIASTSNALWPEIPLDLETTNARLHPSQSGSQVSESEYDATTGSHRRKLHAWTFVQSLTINCIPSYDLSHRLCHLVHSNRHRLLLPLLAHIKIGDRIVWDLADWQNAISIEHRPALHPFTRFLTYAMRPRSVLIDMPELTAAKKVGWWNARYGNRELVDVEDAARKAMLEFHWLTFTARGLDRPLSILAQAWRPHRWVLRNVSVSSGVAVPGRTSQILYTPCQCRRIAGTAPCVDHITARERVRNVISIMCGKVVKTVDSKRSRLELHNISLGSRREEEEMKLNILAQIREHGWGGKLDMIFFP